MNAPPLHELTIADLQRILSETEPAALLVPPRILRRVIKKDRALTGPGLQVPHRKSYVIARERLLRIADRDELGVPPERTLPESLLLFALPDAQRMAERDAGATLLKYWRLLFHARIHQALQNRSNRDSVRQRIQRIGLTEFDEAAAVLRQEHFVLPPGDSETLYEEFAAVYLELRYFSPHALPLYFPAGTNGRTIDAALAEDVDAANLFAATRLPGAPEPDVSPPMSQDEKESLAALPDEREPEPLTLPTWPIAAPRAYRRLLERAEKADARGNMVRAAIFRMRALPLAPPGQANPTRAAACREMELFSRRLQNVLGYSDEDARDWRQALFALLEPAARGTWPSESRLLYDLQKVCIDHERPIFAVDFIEWFASWGRQPIQRLLPFHDSVLMVKHLRQAMHRLTAIRIAEPIRRRLISLLIESSHRCEHRLRERLRPVLRDALDKVGLSPRNVAEQVARDKVGEELIDRVIEHGFLGMGDLRDAIARNRIKLPDLTGLEGLPTGTPLQQVREWCLAVGRGIRTFFLGDALIRANRQLAAALDGIYHRGEVYLRWLQRFSAAAFGTYVGRLLTLYVALPFGCSIALLKVWDEVTELWDKLIGESVPEATTENGDAIEKTTHHLNATAFVGLGIFFLLLFHVRPFRRLLALVLLKLWHGSRWLFHDVPYWLLHLPWVERIFQSGPWFFCYQFLLKPLPLALVCAAMLYRLGSGLKTTLGVGSLVFVSISLLLNSRLGTYLEEVATDRLVRTWHLIRMDLLPGLVRWLIYVFRRLQEETERFIYTVDEWLRFRPGDSRLSLYAKPILGLAWFFFTYLFRLLFNVFIEPTFNPIKHFPAVTVAAKLMAPFYLPMEHAFMDPLIPYTGKLSARILAWCLIGLLPGLAGFLVWEFKENWRLYRANQAATLRPELVGHHGETVARLMRPGLHSGTLPKLYARLRHARGHATRKQYEALHHLRERLRQFVERNLFAVLAGSQSWGKATPLHVGDIAIATNRIRIELNGPGASLHVDFEEHAGWLLSGLTFPTAYEETWLAQLSMEQASAFRDALGGFYKLAGVDAVREQIESRLPAGMDYDMTEEGLLTWSNDAPNSEVLYNLANGANPSPSALPYLTEEGVLYSATPILWHDWVRTWQLDHDGKGHAMLLPPRVRLLPNR